MNEDGVPEEYICRLCGDLLTEARELSCHHCFCTLCLRPLPLHFAEGQPSSVVCPLCASHTPVSMGILSLPRAHYLDAPIDELKALRHSQRPPDDVAAFPDSSAPGYLEPLQYEGEVCEDDEMLFTSFNDRLDDQDWVSFQHSPLVSEEVPEPEPAAPAPAVYQPPVRVQGGEYPEDDHEYAPPPPIQPLPKLNAPPQPATDSTGQKNFFSSLWSGSSSSTPAEKPPAPAPAPGKGISLDKPPAPLLSTQHPEPKPKPAPAVSLPNSPVQPATSVAAEPSTQAPPRPTGPRPRPTFELPMPPQVPPVQGGQEEAKANSSGLFSWITNAVKRSLVPSEDECSTKTGRSQQVIYAVPFAVRAEQSRALVKNWLSSLWFAPSDIQNEHTVNTVRPTLLPYYIFSVDVVTHYHGFKQDRQGNRVKHEGRHVATYTDILMSASADKERSKFLEELETTFRLKQATIPIAKLQLKRPLEPPMRWEEVWTDYFPTVQRAEQTACETLTKSVQPMKVNCEVEIKDLRIKLIYVPFYQGYYSYNNERYQIAVSGQTGKVVGTRPYGSGFAGRLFGRLWGK